VTDLLSRATLSRLPQHVRKPSFDGSELETGIVHLGVGAFHRAHQAVYTDDVLQFGDRRWGTVGASLRAADTCNALRAQDYVYTVAEADHAGERLRIVSALQGLHVAPENPEALLSAMSLPSVKIISMTVTEKGYCHDPATGDLNENHREIQHDIAHPSTPRSAPGYIAKAIKMRKEAMLAPFTVLCCDNLPANGHIVRNVVSRLGALQDPELGAYIAETIAFPSTMVDRIVPATTDQDRDRIAMSLGLRDNWPVVTETFSQWVIEDNFPSGRPDWAATFVSEVKPYEIMKLRLLNGAHSCIAYLGCLSGYETVSDAMQDANLATFVKRLMDEEVTPTLTLPMGADVESYKAALLGRFRNPALRHRTWQIATDGSQKLPQRLLGTARDRLKTGAPIDCLALGVAAWMRYVTGFDEQRQPIDVRDPLSIELRKRADAAGLVADRLAPALLGVDAIFGKDLAASPTFTKAVTKALDQLITRGARQTLALYGKRPV
jgi:fructuronate reductase